MLKRVPFILALTAALPASAQAPDVCLRFCPEPSARILQEFDTKPAAEFLAQRTALIRVFLESLAGNPVFEITRPAGGTPTLTVRLVHEIDGARVLILRSVDLPDATWRDLLAQARSVKDKHERAQVEADAARRAALATGKSNELSELVCLHGASAYFELAGEGTPFGAAAETCNGPAFAIEFANVIEVEALKRMPACDALLREVDGGLSYTVRRCMILNGNRRSAAEVSNLVHTREFSTHSLESPPDVRALQRYFSDNCHMTWEGQLEVIGGFECASTWAHVRAEPTFVRSLYLPAPFENFYGTDTPDAVIVTGRIEKYVSRPVNALPPPNSTEYLSARSSMTWRRAPDGSWKIETWDVGPLRSVKFEPF